MRGFGQVDTSQVQVGNAPVPSTAYQAALETLPVYTPNPDVINPNTLSQQALAQQALSGGSLNWPLIVAGGLLLILFVPMAMRRG